MKRLADYQEIHEDKFPFEHQYEGYLWYSDKQVPEIIMNKTISKAAFSKLPFIVEGNLYAKDAKTSIQIRYRDGAYHIAKIELDADGGKEVEAEEQEYIGHDIQKSGYKSYKMLEAWEEIPGGEALAKMPTLSPTWSAFIGFTNEQNK